MISCSARKYSLDKNRIWIQYSACLYTYRPNTLLLCYNIQQMSSKHILENVQWQGNNWRRKNKIPLRIGLLGYFRSKIYKLVTLVINYKNRHKCGGCVGCVNKLALLIPVVGVGLWFTLQPADGAATPDPIDH